MPLAARDGEERSALALQANAQRAATRQSRNWRRGSEISTQRAEREERAATQRRTEGAFEGADSAICAAVDTLAAALPTAQRNNSESTIIRALHSNDEDEDTAENVRSVVNRCTGGPVAKVDQVEAKSR